MSRDLLSAARFVPVIGLLAGVAMGCKAEAPSDPPRTKPLPTLAFVPAKSQIMDPTAGTGSRDLGTFSLRDGRLSIGSQFTCRGKGRATITLDLTPAASPLHYDAFCERAPFGATTVVGDAREPVLARAASVHVTAPAGLHWKVDVYYAMKGTGSPGPG